MFPEVSSSLQPKCGNNEKMETEQCMIGRSIIELPYELCQREDLFHEVINLETWENILTADQRKHLMTFLPKFEENDEIEKYNTLRLLFMNKNVKFGNPLVEFQRNLKDGMLAPDIVKISSEMKKAKCVEYQRQQQRYYCKLVQNVLISRKKLLEAAVRLPPDQPVRLERILPKSRSEVEQRTKRRYFKELQDMREEVGEVMTSSEDENYPEGLPPKLSKRQKRMLEASLGSDAPSVVSTFATRAQVMENGASSRAALQSPNPFEVSEEHYRDILLVHKRRRANMEDDPDLDTRSLTLQDIISRTNVSRRSASRQLVVSESTSKKKAREREKSEKKKHQVKVDLPSSPKSSVDIVESVKIPKLDMPLEVDIKKEPVDDETPDDTAIEVEGVDEPDLTLCLPRASTPTLLQGTYSSFFGLLRNVICESADFTITTSKLEEKVQIWQESPFSGLNDWYSLHLNWPELVLSAIKFLAGVTACPLPDNFIPYVNYLEKSQQWKWIGDHQDTSEHLAALAHHWLDNRSQEDLALEMPDSMSIPAASGSPPPPRVSTEWIVRPTTDEEKTIYYEQERLRYLTPHKAFTFRMHGYESVVGPVKGVYGKDNAMNKAREHSLLVSVRPPFVTILSLVRDAAARLPNGEGTRSDICELLKDSQYFAVSNEAQFREISAVVSGALDRLHYEKDPCVKYDVNRKIWIYLHRSRTEEEFERIHQAQASVAKTKKAVPKTKLKSVKSKDTSRPATGLTTANADDLSNTDLSSITPSTTSVSLSPLLSTSVSALPSSPHKLVSHPVAASTANSSISMSIPLTMAGVLGGLRHGTKHVVGMPSVGSLPVPISDSATSPATPMSTSPMHTTVTAQLVLPQSQSGVPSLKYTSRPVPSSSSIGSSGNNPPMIGVSQVQILGATLSNVAGNPTTGIPVSSALGEQKHSSQVSIGSPTIAITTSLPSTVHGKFASSIMAQQKQLTSGKATKVTMAAAPSHQATTLVQPLVRVSKDSPLILTGTPLSSSSTSGSTGAMKLASSSLTPGHTGKSVSSAMLSGALSQATIQGVPTIVIKQEGGTQMATAAGAVGRAGTTTSKPVVARIISSPQVVSVGSLIASTLAVAQKQGSAMQPSTTTVKIQGSNIIRPVGGKPGQMSVIQTSPASGGVNALPRLALVSQGSTANLIQVSGASVSSPSKLVAAASGQIGFMASQLAAQQASVAAGGKSAILTTPGGIKIVSAASNMNLSHLGTKQIAGGLGTGKSTAQTPVTVTVATNAGTGAQNLIITSNSSSSSPSVVIASQGTLKPTQTVVMSTSGATSTVVMATQSGLRPLTAASVTPVSMKTLQGVKVIPVSQSAGAGVTTSVVKGTAQPMFARIITSPTGLTLRPAMAPSAGGTSQQGLGVLQAMAHMPAMSMAGPTVVTNPATLTMRAASSVGTSAARPQTAIIRVQNSQVVHSNTMQTNDQTNKEAK